MDTVTSALSRVFAAVRGWIFAHKTWSLILALAFITGGYFAVQRIASPTGQARYVLGSAKIGSIVSSVAVSGQVSATDQLDIKSKVSSEVISVPVSAGDGVKAGSVIARLNSETAQKAVRDARANLETAQIALEKLKKPAGELTLLQAENAVTNAEDDLDKAYKDSLTHITDAFQDLPDLMESLKDIVIGTDTNSNLQWNIDFYRNAIEQYDNKVVVYRNDAYNAYLRARDSYDKAFASYSAVGVTADAETTENLLERSHKTAQEILAALKAANTLVQLYKDAMTARNLDVSSAATAALTELSTHITAVNDHVALLLADTNGLKSRKQTLSERRAALEDTIAGADALDLQSAQLSVTKAQNALTDAESNLSDYVIRAPYDATVATLEIKRYDTVASGGVVASLITSQKFAELSLNEVDVSKIEVGDEATLRFDAVDDLVLSGKVAQIDAVGTVSQGVVSYTVKVAFDALDEKVKPGMTVDTDIITDTKQDILTVPSSAIKTMNGKTYVLVFDPPLEAGLANSPQGGAVYSTRTPMQVAVVTGITNDSTTEVVSGLRDGQQIVVRSMSSSGQGATQAPSIIGTPGTGARSPGAGGVRLQTR